MRALKIGGGAIAAVIVIALLLLAVGIPSGFLTSTIQARVERATGYRLTIAGTTKIGIWPSLNVTLNDVTLEPPKDRDGVNRVTLDSVAGRHHPCEPLVGPSAGYRTRYRPPGAARAAAARSQRTG